MFRLCILIVGFGVINILGKSIQQGPSPKMKLIGNFDGHAYFYDNAGHTYANSEQYCLSLGMDLAEINTVELQQMLINHYKIDPEFSYPYWVAASDALSPVQFVWKKSGTPMTPGFIWGYFSGPYTCIDFYRTGFDADPCTNMFGTICQS